jgi:hypothetical protein
MPKSFLPGDATWYASDSPTTSYSAVFEDDGDTGYFYAYDRGASEGHAILDACHVYNVRNVVDREVPSEVSVIWTADGLKAALLLNGRPHAVLDFTARRGYCRSNWPAPKGAWRSEASGRAPWDEAPLTAFRTPDA